MEIQPIGAELAIKWEDGSESYLPLETLRRACPCAGCKGERDILGNVYRNPDRPYAAGAFELRQLNWIGGYAVQPVWGDGHNSGLFAFDYLKGLAESAASSA
jgi:DUF971 family protein